LGPCHIPVGGIISVGLFPDQQMLWVVVPISEQIPSHRGSFEDCRRGFGRQRGHLCPSAARAVAPWRSGNPPDPEPGRRKNPFSRNREKSRGNQGTGRLFLVYGRYFGATRQRFLPHGRYGSSALLHPYPFVHRLG